MKKTLLLGTILCISLSVTACSQLDKEQSKEEPKVNQEEQVEGTPLTDEEMKEISENVENALRENVKYKFGKVLSIEGTTIEVSIIETPKWYEDKGYNDNLDIDTSKLKETGESISIDLIGINSNILPEEINEVKYVRIGIYESDKDDNVGFEQGQVTSVDRIN
ncbi:hypothetical protein [Clostridium sp. CCUG 7971]|uniref:hypothetical protein n=1 Tax=Clostridium sp. CCUG 7971 TaxID=2811414 RepID=UPI001ABBC9D9|nr:hypothetical protein [Clostridium sp. CCUG 7971]MBO3444291.1 hypothetical protein [Clostridium sp. CCUG 7971]